MEQIKHLLREKHSSEYRFHSKLKTFSAFLVIKILIQESKKILSRVFLYNCRAFDWHVDRRNQTGSYAECQVWRLSEVSTKICSFNSVQSGLWSKKKSGQFSTGSFVTTPWISIGILVQQIEPENSEIIEFEYRNKSKSIAPFGTFLSIKFLLQGKQSTSFRPKRLLKNEFFRFRPQW